MVYFLTPAASLSPKETESQTAKSQMAKKNILPLEQRGGEKESSYLNLGYEKEVLFHGFSSRRYMP